MEGTATRDRLGQLDLALGRRAETGADLERLFQGLHDGGMAMPQQQRPPRADVIDVAVAVDIEQIRAFTARDEDRVRRPRCETPAPAN